MVTLTNQVALVTGGGRGIGRAIALALASAGAAVIVSARTESEIAAVVAEIERQGGRAAARPGDVSRAADVDRIFGQTVETFGPVTILFNNAGVPGPLPLLHEISQAEWEETLAVNLTGVFLCCKAALPGMIARGGGNIINVSSGAGLKKPRERVRSLPYQVSKFGVEGLTDALAIQMRPYGINVNSLIPGTIATRFHENTPRDDLAAHSKMSPPEIVVPAALYLAGQAPGALTGQTIVAKEITPDKLGASTA